MFRHVRAGVTISKLGWNLGVSALQILGINQTMVQLGKRDTMAGVMTFMNSPWSGQNSIFKVVAEQSGFMQQRQATFHKDINDVNQILSKSFGSKFWPGKSKQFFQDSMFWMIKFTQQIVDTITWLSAHKQGMKQFDGSQEQAIRHADRMVARTQASGIFGERTPVERGTINKSLRQKEFVKIWTNFMSYFMAKTNIAIEQYKTTNFRSPAEVMNFSMNMALLYSVETMLALIIRGQFPDEDESWVAWGAKESAFATVAGIPFLRALGGELQGYRGGNAVDTTFKEFGQLWDQVEQGEIDIELFSNFADVAGIVFHLPTGQISKTGRAGYKWWDGEDIGIQELLMGPNYEN
jgi:hypothetical protein